MQPAGPCLRRTPQQDRIVAPNSAFKSSKHTMTGMAGTRAGPARRSAPMRLNVGNHGQSMYADGAQLLLEENHMPTYAQQQKHMTAHGHVHPTETRVASRVRGVLRIGLGLVFLWAFFDKLLGLGFATARENAWINGGSPTFGFLNFGAADSPFAGVFQAMAGHPVVDTLFMLGLLGVGLAFTLGVGMFIGAYAGAAMLLLMYLALLPLENHPFIDDHIIYGVAMVYLAHASAGKDWGLGTWWQKQKIVRKHPILE